MPVLFTITGMALQSGYTCSRASRTRQPHICESLWQHQSGVFLAYNQCYGSGSTTLLTMGPIFDLLRSGRVFSDPLPGRIQDEIPPFFTLFLYSLYIFLHNCGEKFVLSLQIDFPKQGWKVYFH